MINTLLLAQARCGAIADGLTATSHAHLERAMCRFDPTATTVATDSGSVIVQWSNGTSTVFRIHTR